MPQIYYLFFPMIRPILAYNSLGARCYAQTEKEPTRNNPIDTVLRLEGLIFNDTFGDLPRRGPFARELRLRRRRRIGHRRPGRPCLFCVAFLVPCFALDFCLFVDWSSLQSRLLKRGHGANFSCLFRYLAVYQRCIYLSH